MQIVILHRPTGTIGGDMLVASSLEKALNGLGHTAETRPADHTGDLSAADFVILCAACSPDWGLPAAIAAKQAGKTLVTLPYWWSRDNRQAFYGKQGQDIAPGYLRGVAQILQLSDVLMTVTMSEAQECWKLAPRKPVHVIGIGAEQTWVQQQETQDYVVCLGRVEKHKNQRSLAQACKEIGAPLMLVGEVVDPYYAAQCSALGANVLGKLTRKDALDLLARARVHALVSFFENPGLSSLEALQMGIPAVMGSEGAQVEFFGTAGIYCDPVDWRDIAQALIQAWDAPRTQYTFPTWEDTASEMLAWMEAHQ